MKTACVAIDSWKLEVFKKRLDDAGYEYTVEKGIAKDAISLVVKYDFVANLQPIVEAANKACLLIKK